MPETPDELIQSRGQMGSVYGSKTTFKIHRQPLGNGRDKVLLEPLTPEGIEGLKPGDEVIEGVLDGGTWRTVKEVKRWE